MLLSIPSAARIFLFCLFIALLTAGCTTRATSRYFGQTAAPKDNILRYVTGGEPESLDPQVPNGQPDARILMAIYDGLVEYDPKTSVRSCQSSR